MGDLLAISTVVDNANIVATIDTTGASFSQIAEGWNPVWSPDGARIAYGSGSGTKIVDLATLEVTAVMGCEGAPLDWSSDGRHLLCQADGPSLRMVDMSTDLGISDFLAQGARGAFSPDGTRVVFDRETAPNSRDLFVIPTAGGAEIQLTVTAPDKYWASPRWFRGR